MTGSTASMRISPPRSRPATARAPTTRWTSMWPTANRACGRCSMPFAGARCRERGKMNSGLVQSDDSSVFPRMLDLACPNVERGEGVRLHTTDGRVLLDGCSGGAMTACLGHGVPELVDAAAEQSQRITYVYNHHFTNDRQEEYAERLLTVAAPEMARVRFASGGSEANEAAVRLARSYHVERGHEQRRLIVSASEAYHGATFGALALTGRRSLQEPYREYLPRQSHVAAGDLSELDRLLDVRGADVAAFFCEPVSAASRAAWAPPDGASATASSSASTRWSQAWAAQGTGSRTRACR